MHASSGFAIGRAIVVLLLVTGMLTAFHAVVSGATRTGELRRQAMAAQAAEIRRCNALAGSVSTLCRKDLKTSMQAFEASIL
jgi:hypothetical protein